MNKNGILYTIIFSFITTFAFVFFLALANVVTEDIVAENQKIAAYRAILNAMGIEYDPDNRSDVFAKYEQVEELETQEARYYRSHVNGETVWGLRTNGPGLWGNIEVVIGFNEDVSRYMGLEIIDQTETPGLGGRIADDWFKDQFTGQLIPNGVFDGGNLAFVAGSGAGDANKEDSSVDAITGATRTSEGMQAIVSQAAREMATLVGEN